MNENWITQIYLNCEKKKARVINYRPETQIRCQANFSFLYFSFRFFLNEEGMLTVF